MICCGHRKLSISSKYLRHIRANKMAYKFSIGLAMMAIQIGWLGISFSLAFFVTFMIYLATGGWRFFRLLWLTFPRDLRLIIFHIKHQLQFKRVIRQQLTVCDLFSKTVTNYPDRVAFMFEDKKWTFRDVECFSNKVANYFQSVGYSKGDVVAIFMENRPEFVFFWLGLAKIGVISALVNYNLRKDSLVHCVSISKAKGLIYSCELADAVSDILPRISDVRLYEFGDGIFSGLQSENLLKNLKSSSHSAPTVKHMISNKDILFYIYTSGTTGFPKASVIRHVRFINVAIGFSILSNSKPDVVLYCALPLYHTSGGMLGAGSTLIRGSTLVVRKKFSARCFWDDCIKYKATRAIYIGEICRYLLAQPPKDCERKHSLSVIFGNGLRPQIWNEFKERFNIPRIVEFYGATEGNVGLVNLDGHSGAIGFIPVISSVPIVKIFKVEMGTGQLLRGSDGFCIPCKPGEIGQIAGKIVAGDETRRFDGYVNKKATNNKIAHDVLKKGDQWFLSGDAVYWDELGYVYFHDRLGDTFRWRGENVSTSEVEAIMANVLSLNSVVVYGVEIPGCEGRAGMAAIEDPHDVIDVKFLSQKLRELLPSYAKPVFLRITNTVDVTGTFKFQKAVLKKEGFDPTLVRDKLFYFDDVSGEYNILTEEIYRKFVAGDMRI
ncbi:long-chain fatty acid transport protein 4-like [Xenia sp. Carnegie-2017]|uniref:long-chain fatty acid transport protein 4-like n=1 Tax=Xenia sp. Carnegie-2017 TaxID=2897299 RepID=UPI001F04E09C|nr:long-chain fatty acid transport protein 4-like [Xenia sp. Carnegie-2017]